MNLLTNTDPMSLWYGVVKEAEGICEVTLETKLENYLVVLLNHYIDKPELLNQILATAMLNAQHLQDASRDLQLKHVGDQCLIFAGLFPKSASRKHVKINYFVEMGRSAYAGIRHATGGIYGSLAMQFVMLMDVLQSIRHADLTPFEAYEQWHLVGSRRALAYLQSYENMLFFKK